MICELCPRRCRAERTEETGNGFCGMGTDPVVARAAPHFGEEPCISGPGGSGAVFFSGCTLGCLFCQNAGISRGRFGERVTPEHLREIFLNLCGQGVRNLNLVTAGHFTDGVLRALEGGVPVPVIWNSSGYERVETLRRLEGAIQVYLPDLKYLDRDMAARYSSAPDYPEAAKAAILEMYRQTGPYELDGDGCIVRGVVVRHLVMPGGLENTFRVVDWVAETFRPGEILFSLMSQFTPRGGAGRFPELGRRITEEEHRRAVDYLMASGIEDGFYQDPDSSGEESIPAFDLTGVV